MPTTHDLYFRADELNDAPEEYVAWVDVMGIQSALGRSAKVAANFVYKLHDAALQSRTDAVRLYPVMDGLYACATSAGAIEEFLRAVFWLAVREFTKQEYQRFRFIIKGSLAHGPVYHGADVAASALPRSLRDDSAYRGNLLLGEPMVVAHGNESQAPPFGVFVDSSASDLIGEGQSFPFDVWWRWFTADDEPLLTELRSMLDRYYEWCTRKSDEIAYPKSRIRIHRGQASLYFRGTEG